MIINNFINNFQIGFAASEFWHQTYSKVLLRVLRIRILDKGLWT